MAAFARGLKQIRLEHTYFAAALLGSDTGWNMAFETCFAGFPEGRGPDDGVELREPVPVYPDRMVRLWAKAGQGWVVVNERAQLIWLLRFGGNALIAEEVAREHLAEFIRPIEVLPNGAVGLRRFDPDARDVKYRRPRPKQKARILERVVIAARSATSSVRTTSTSRSNFTTSGHSARAAPPSTRTSSPCATNAT